MCIVDSIEPAQILAELDPDLDPRQRADINQLVVMRSSHVFCRSGRFSANETIGFWKVALSEAMYDSRFEMVRAVDTWSQHDVVVDPDEHLLLESEMNRVLPLYPQVALCLYDLEHFGGALIFNLLRTHPMLLLGGLLLENPYYLSPDEVMAETAKGRANRVSCRRWLSVPNRESWLDIARKVDWQYSYVKEQEVFPAEISGRPWLDHAAWAEWNEAYRTTYREYVANQRAKDESVMGVRSVLSKARLSEELDPGWVQLLKFHYGALALAEYTGAVAELRMARFGRDSAWRTMATLGALDEIRHTQIPLAARPRPAAPRRQLRLDAPGLPHTRMGDDRGRHLFDDMFLAADAIDVAVQLNFVFETGFSNLQFMAMAAMADNAHDHLFEKALTSIQTDESGTLRSDTPSFAPSSTTETKSGLNIWSTRCGGAVGGCSSCSPARPWSI